MILNFGKQTDAFTIRSHFFSKYLNIFSFSAIRHSDGINLVSNSKLSNIISILFSVSWKFNLSPNDDHAPLALQSAVILDFSFQPIIQNFSYFQNHSSTINIDPRANFRRASQIWVRTDDSHLLALEFVICQNLDFLAFEEVNRPAISALASLDNWAFGVKNHSTGRLEVGTRVTQVI